jgi:hypothetical protein
MTVSGPRSTVASTLCIIPSSAVVTEAVTLQGDPDWTWEVVPLDSIAQVTVSWDVYLKTLDRKLLAGPIRQRQLRKEVAASLLALDQASRSA